MRAEYRAVLYEAAALGLTVIGQILTLMAWLAALAFYLPPFLTFLAPQGFAGTVLGLWAVIFLILLTFKIVRLNLWAEANVVLVDAFTRFDKKARENSTVV